MEVAAIIILKPSGEFFVHQRTGERKSYPNLYGLGAGGKIESGETPECGAKRELFEETGIVEEPIPLFAFDFSDQLTSYKMHVFQVITEQSIIPDAREWQWSGWMYKSQVELLDQQQKLCPDTSIFFRRYVQEQLRTNKRLV